MSHDDRVIHKATVADAPSIARVHVTCWHETYKGIVPEAVLATLSVPRRTVAWENILRDPAKHDDSAVYFRRADNEIAGFGACGNQRDSDLKGQGFDGEIGSIYVLQKFQRRGIGRSLISALAGDLVSRGHHGVALWVLRENAAARHFYERFAGEVIGEKKDVRGEAVLVEIAYGWRNLEELQSQVGSASE